MAKKAVNKTCTVCGKIAKSLYRNKSDFCCAMCYRKKITYIGTRMKDYRSNISLEDALNKVYTIKGHKSIDKNGNPKIQQSHICPPSILIGHKVKLVLAGKNGS